MGPADPGGGEEKGGPGHRLWGGRFASGPAPSLEALNRSLPVDARLWREDIEASRAWARALVGVGVLSAAEAETLDRGLQRVAGRMEEEVARGAADEDVHTLAERLLYEEVGAVAGKLHTGRSRNDQIATDARLWALEAGGRVDAELRALGAALLDGAETTVDLAMPAYTHLRRAQPIRVAHWYLAHFWALARDRQRLDQALERVAVLPLGSGAISGSAYPVDREALRERLGFSDVSPNSLDAVGDRDWIAELVFVSALAAVHLSRLAEDLIVFSTDEFGFVALPEAFTTGSSLLPQKRNPDGLELARGCAGRLIGALTAILAILKGLPSGYQKDLQEDKRIVFEAVDALLALLPVTRETVAGLTWRRDRLESAVNDEALFAVDLADALVRRGMPFREAHGAVGRLLRAAEERGVAVRDLPRSLWNAAVPGLEPEGVGTIDLEGALEARSLPGGTGRRSVLAQIRDGRRMLAGPRAAV